MNRSKKLVGIPTRKNRTLEAVQEQPQPEAAKQLLVGMGLEANDPLQLFLVSPEQATDIFETYKQNGTFAVSDGGGRMVNRLTTYMPHTLVILSVEAQHAYAPTQQDMPPEVAAFIAGMASEGDGKQ